MLSRAGGADLDDPETQIRANQFLRYRGRGWFEELIDEVRDGSECELARERAGRGANGRLALRTSCAKTECDCRQIEFVDDHISDWKEAGSALAKTARRDG